MALTLQTKQPAESRVYDFDFSGIMPTGATITAVSGVTSTPSGLTVGGTAFSGQIAQVRLSSGTTATEYLITCTVTTSTSDTLELEGRLWVEDVTTLSALEQAALDQLVIMTEANSCPTLDYLTATSELRIILGRYRRATVWAASTAYQIGEAIVPTAANRTGHHYRLIQYTATATDQKTGATEPVWSVTRDSRHTDNHVIWQEDGWDWDGVLWNLAAAAEEAWTLKASKSVARIDFAPAQGQSISASQLYEHCLKQADRFRSAYCL